MGVLSAIAVLVIIAVLLKKANDYAAKHGQGSARLNRLIEEVQAKQAGLSSSPTHFRGQYTAPVAGQALPTTSRPAPGQPPLPGQFPGPVHAPPGQFQPPPPATWLPSHQPPPPHIGLGIASHRPPQNNLPAQKGDTDNRVRELMAAHNEVGAVRLLCDDQDMGIIEAQEYARGLVAPPGAPAPRSTGGTEPVEEETRYVGSAAFAESIFDTDADENTWASGWVDKPDPDDRSDLDELWQTVRNQGRPPSA